MALKIDNDIVHATATETIMQNTEAFESGTNGAIRVASENIVGDLQETSMLAEISNLIGRRDVSSDGSATSKTIDSRDENNIKLYWGTGDIQFKVVDATRYGSDEAAFSAAIGEQIGKGIVTYLLNSAIRAGRAAIESQAGLVTGDGTGAITPTLLNSSLIPMGDNAGSVVCWVMKYVSYNQLVGDALSGDADVAFGALYQGTTGTLGKPVYITDSSGLDMTTGVAVLGLTMDAIIATESTGRTFISELVGGGENIKYRIQGEGEFMLNVKGFSWKTASGVNPTDANVGTAANWELKASNVKSGAGVILNVA
jgi:hypothetical protein